MSTIHPAIYVPLGCAGSGKGTFAQVIQGEDYEHLSTGDLTRDEVSRGTDFGLKYEYVIARHIMGGIPFSEILSLIQSRVEEALAKKKGVILDGFPKNEMQCELLDTFAQERSLDVVPLWIQVDETTALNRISFRQICDKCKKIYHARFCPPQTAGICDSCQIPLTTRAGDNPAKAEERIRGFSKEMTPVLTYYESRERLHKLDGNGTPEECRERFEAFHRAMQTTYT